MIRAKSLTICKDDIAQLNSAELRKEGVKRVEIVDALRDRAIREYEIENLTGALLNFESVAKTLKKDLPYVVVCYCKKGDSYEFEMVDYTR